MQGDGLVSSFGQRPFTRLIHADWSSRPQGRWAAVASKHDGRWCVGAPTQVGPEPAFVDDLFAAGPTLVGFDMPIGLPIAFAVRTGLPDFRAALAAFGTGAWAQFYDVADRPADIGPLRPFYPARPGTRGSVSHRHLAEGHGVAHLADLLRRCERAGPSGRPASPLFWTLGPSAVGKAAIHGWQRIVAPALTRGAALWPFDGDLDALARTKRPVLAETYPADVYARLGLSFKGRAKTRQSDRRDLAGALTGWMADRAVDADPALADALVEGFGPAFGNDDGFDAVVGLLGMIGVVTGERVAGAPDDDATRRWEGWILGRAG